MESVMPSSHLILYCPLLLPSSIFPSTRVFSNESARRIRWPKYWSFSFNITPSNEHSGLISFRIDWLDLLAVQGTLKSLLQYHSSKASWSWFPLSSLSTFLPSYPSQEMVMPCLYEKPKNHHRLMFTSCAIQEQTLIALSSKYIQSLTISHHLHWCHYVQATIISHLGHFCDQLSLLLPPYNLFPKLMSGPLMALISLILTYKPLPAWSHHQSDSYYLLNLFYFLTHSHWS